MKSSALKSTRLALVTRASESETPAPRSDRLDDYFDGWLHAVAPRIVPAKPVANKMHSPQENRRLTASDVIRVIRATVRESHDHRHWPPDVVQKFLVAEVITRKRKR